jgi:hypothetical protein
MADEPTLGEMVKCLQLICTDVEEGLRYAKTQEVANRGPGNEKNRQCWMKVIARLERTVEARKQLELMAAARADRLTPPPTGGTL